MTFPPTRSSRLAPAARLTGAATAALALTFAATGASAAPAGEPAASAAECTTDGFCEDFETQTGSAPSGRWATEFPDCSGTGTASVDTSVAHTGTTSIRVNGGLGYCNHVFVGTELDDVATDSGLYVRFWVRHSDALPTQHVTFLAMEDAADGARDLRMGGQNGALQWNRESDDATLPAQSPAGVALSAPLPVGEWSCVEFQLDSAGGLLETWLNGTSVTGLAVDGTPTHDIDAQWLNRGAWHPDLTDLRFGWESYGEGTDTLWYDDIAVGTTRTGC
ncbi:hydrolase [Streptomyces litchfieldiae]|uniref:Hydrolase n=1 Tax=Streptomyces litchfieldiae TaxID=3075543 RepID=A0ABU2MQV9_9ACTN|nr:hydrolase [Streptomyces sp. DSM 44938]MDT0344017.1 hydrolase [Streptomyces sp. DSM 44938]